jgi:hypothetical protein
MFNNKLDKFNQYLLDIPLLHTWDNGKTFNTGGFGAEHLTKIYNFLKNNLNNNFNIIETGAGNSTITFLLLDNISNLITIAPDEELKKKIIEYCDKNLISSKKLTFITDKSEFVLPNIVKNKDPFVDFCLIDGNHNFPMVFLDFWYLHLVVKKNCYIMIDDINLYSSKELVKYLYEQPGYRIVENLGKAVIFIKETDDNFQDWTSSKRLKKKFDYDFLFNNF